MVENCMAEGERPARLLRIEMSRLVDLSAVLFC